MLAENADIPDGLILLGIGESYHPTLCQMMAQARFFKEFGADEIAILADYTGAYEARNGTWIFREGIRGSFLCLLVSGRVDIIKESSKKITTIRPGKTMGEMSVIDGFPFSASALAVEDSVLLYLTRHQFRCFSEKHPRIAVKFYQQLARLMSLRLRQTTGVLVDYL